MVKNSPMIKPLRGEIWRVALNPVRGSEQAKTRPVVVVGRPGFGRPSMQVCVPFTTRQPAHASMLWCVPIHSSSLNGLSKLSTADTSQIRAIDIVRFEVRLGNLSDEDLQTIVAAVMLIIGFDADE